MLLLFAVVAVCLLWCADAGSSSVASSPADEESELLWSQRYYHRKTFFSNTSRAVFVAGLEGSGHHLVRAIANGCNRVDETKKKKKATGGKNSSNIKKPGKNNTRRQL